MPNIISSYRDLLKTKAFYKSINFTPLNKEETMFTDGSVVVELDGANKSRNGLHLYKIDIEKVSQNFPKGWDFKSVENKLFTTDPNGVHLVLDKGSCPHQIPKQTHKSMLGNCAGIGLETFQWDLSIQFWSALGFVVEMGDAKKKGWVQIGHPNGGKMALMYAGMCPHSFANPSVTYFNGKEGNPKVLYSLRENKIPIYEEVTVFSAEKQVDNVILRDPNGIGFFIFND